MRFTISGTDEDTGEPIEMTVEAPDEAGAQEAAHRKGIVVTRVALLRATHPAAQARSAAIGSPLESGHQRGAPVVNVSPPRRGNSLGVAALVLGILAFLICWIPLVNLLGVPLSALGLFLGLVGLVVALIRKGASIGYPIAGTAVCGLALFIAISMTGAFVGGLKKAGDEIIRDAERRNATNQTAALAPAADSDEINSPTSDELLTAGAGSVPPSTSIPPPDPNEPEVDWGSAEFPVKQADTQIQIMSVLVGKVPLKDRFDDGGGESKDVLLMVELEITNLSETKKLEYRTWGGRAMSFGTRTALTDNFDNRYIVVNFGFGNEVVGSVESESIYPGQSTRDVLVFEKPIDKVEHLNLELPATQFGGEGMIRIRIPASMIQK